MKENGCCQNDEAVRILLVEDHPVVRESLKLIIQRDPNLKVCGEAEDCKQALMLVSEIRPQLVILDLTLRDSHGLELIKDLREHHPNVLSLVFSMHEESMLAERVIRAGARGYLTKQENPAKILTAIRQVLKGEIYWSEKTAAQIASKIAMRPRSSNGFSLEFLTDRELQVFELMGQGQSTRQIAGILHIDASTVDTYSSRIKEKLNLKNRRELIQYAIRFQMLPKDTMAN
ncbi:MAG TPA: response regulator transcription factor [Verrucomicrobiae bacterium]|nr:response regulator transcription factor [Verrucomicrobiae bacterium]